ncbi:MAG: histidine phosphatase family protein, partial [Bacillota bacterium]|nr:histidine phosphatase family protein [Bacillota bacterium]
PPAPPPVPFVVATFEGKKGHPLFVPAEYIDEICDFEGEGGLAAVTDRHEMLRVETGEEGCILDMDTPEGYEDIKTFVAKGFAREKLELLTARKRIFLVRHGETEQHDEPMFIGQYDVPLSDEGRKQAESLGHDIAEAMREDVEAEALGMDKFGKEPMPAIERIYASDLARASETAEIICEKVNEILPEQAKVKVKTISGLREINLGQWDGRAVSEIKAEFPEEYEKRGKNLLSFKLRGGGAENFYDMQYRVVAAFRELLRNDDAKDIIIVAHSAVIRALENNILGGHVEDQWEPMKKGSFRMFEPFPEQPSEKVHGDKPMNMNDMIMDSVLDYYD